MIQQTNWLRDCGKPLFYPCQNASSLIKPPTSRGGDSVRLYVRSLSEMQKEALVSNTRSGRVWRLASDEGAYLNGFNEAPCPLSFFTVGMVSSFMNEIQALATQRDIEVYNIQLTQDNYYTMNGSAMRGNMVGGAKNIRLEAYIDSDGDQASLERLVTDAISASPLNGLINGEKKVYLH